MSRLPDPAVPPDAYDEEYFREVCGGHEEWSASSGGRSAGIYAGSLARAGIRAGEVLVDIGTGRGEMVAEAVGRGAALAIGVEYAPAAVALARETLAARGAGSRGGILLADGRALPLRDASADVVTMLDVVEHLAPAELDRALTEAFRILRPGGRILVHTFPTRTIYSVTYRLQRLASPSRRVRWPADPRNEYEHRMHVNEQTAGTLRRALRRAGFRRATASPGEWIHADFVPDERARALYRRLARVPSLRRFGAANLWGEGVRPR